MSKISENVASSRKKVVNAAIYKGFTCKIIIGKVHIIDGEILRISA